VALHPSEIESSYYKEQPQPQQQQQPQQREAGNLEGSAGRQAGQAAPGSNRNTTACAQQDCDKIKIPKGENEPLLA
jgi:hypothetical protein